MGLLDHGELQRDHAAVVLVQEVCATTSAGCSVSSILINIGMWFRALRDRRLVAAPRLPARELGLLPGDVLGLRLPDRQLRACSSRCSACSPASCPWWRPRRSRRLLPEADPHQGEELVRVVRGGLGHGTRRRSRRLAGRGRGPDMGLMHLEVPEASGGYSHYGRCWPASGPRRRFTVLARRFGTPATRSGDAFDSLPGPRPGEGDGPQAVQAAVPRV